MRPDILSHVLRVSGPLLGILRATTLFGMEMPGVVAPPDGVAEEMKVSQHVWGSFFVITIIGFGVTQKVNEMLLLVRTNSGSK